MLKLFHPKICANICSDNDKTMGTGAGNKMEAIDTSETVPIVMLKFFCSNLKSAPISVKVSVMVMILQ